MAKGHSLTFGEQSDQGVGTKNIQRLEEGGFHLFNF